MQNLNPGDVITFTEYEVSPLSGKRHFRQRMENMTVHAVIAPGEVLPKDRIEEYYGENLPADIRMALSVSPAARLIMRDDEGALYSVNLVEDFLKSGLQEIEVGTRALPEQAGAPSYMQFLNAFGG